jgi:hypothetical protein
MSSLLLSIALFVLVVGPLLGWVFYEDRRRRRIATGRGKEVG